MMGWVRSGVGTVGKVRQWAGWVRLICEVGGGGQRVGKVGLAGLILRKKLQPLPWRRMERGESGERAGQGESAGASLRSTASQVPSTGSTQKSMLI